MLLKFISILLVISSNFGNQTSGGIITFYQSGWHEKFQTIQIFDQEKSIGSSEIGPLHNDFSKAKVENDCYSEPINILNTNSINRLTLYFSSRLK